MCKKIKVGRNMVELEREILYEIVGAIEHERCRYFAKLLTKLEEKKLLSLSDIEGIVDATEKWQEVE